MQATKTKLNVGQQKSVQLFFLKLCSSKVKKEKKTEVSALNIYALQPFSGPVFCIKPSLKILI
jgi:hypothetical protein